MLNIILFDEVQYRKNQRRLKLLKSAGFKSQASLEGVTYEKIRNFDKKLIQEIASLRFIDESQNIVIFGATGVGKTYLATAIGNHTCRSGRPVLFFKMNILFEKIALARAEATYLYFLKKIHAAALLIIDDFGLRPLTDQQFQDLYDVLSERESEKSTILTTQLPSENWNDLRSLSM
jgi:DNA replication protein DnaC